jgi:hypothetical protein
MGLLFISGPVFCVTLSLLPAKATALGLPFSTDCAILLLTDTLLAFKKMQKWLRTISYF